MMILITFWLCLLLYMYSIYSVLYIRSKNDSNKSLFFLTRTQQNDDISLAACSLELPGEGSSEHAAANEHGHRPFTSSRPPGLPPQR